MSDIATLFARDPEKMSEADIDALIAAMREKRHIFNSGPAPMATKLTKKETEVTNKLDLKIDLGGL
jgi:hypothetical protein